MAKLITRDALAIILNRERGNGKTIGFTSGAFDLLHAGHLRYLEAAKQNCDVLVVGVNSDSSVRCCKGPLRPVVPELERAEIVSHIDVVDYVFLFSEPNNAVNIRTLQPDRYIKGGDYSPARLTSAHLLPENGKFVLIPFEAGHSTTSLIERIQSLPVTSQFHPEPVCRAVFVDRDGTLMESMDYPKDPGKVHLLPGAAEGLKQLQDAGYALIVVTNQPGIGLGYYTEEEFYRVDLAFRKQVHAGGAMVDRVYYCPHNEKDGCPCRKPKPYFIERAARELGVKPQESWVIGDSTADIEMGRRAGVRTILVRTGHGGRDRRYAARPDRITDGIPEAVQFILSHRGS